MTPLLAQRPRVDRSFERLYRRHVADVYHYALAVLRNPTDAEDVTQTTFLNAYRAFQRGERPTAPQNWLIAIAHNVCRQRFRQSSRRPMEVGFDEDMAESAFDDDAPSANDIRVALGHLAFNQRAALVMRELEGRSYGEIAEILGLSVSAVETLIFRARRALREQLEGALTCNQAELAISRQIDGRLPRSDRGALRAHLRECKECSTFARSQRAQRSAFKAIAAVPLPSSLTSFFGGGSAGAGAGAGLAAKAAVALTTTALVGGVGYEGARHLPLPSRGAGHARVSTTASVRRAVAPALAPSPLGAAQALPSAPAARTPPALRADGRSARHGRGKPATHPAAAKKEKPGNGQGQASAEHGNASPPGQSARAEKTNRSSKAQRRGQSSQQSNQGRRPQGRGHAKGRGSRGSSAAFGPPGKTHAASPSASKPADSSGNGNGHGNGNNGPTPDVQAPALPQPPPVPPVPVPEVPKPGKGGGKK